MSESRSFGRDQVERALRDGFPDDPDIDALQIIAVDESTCELRLNYDDRQLRPGGTISGPTLMKLADTAMYAALMGAFDRVPIAYTTNLSIEFLRRPGPTDLIARSTIIKKGRSRFTGRVELRSEGVDGPVAIAIVSYHVVE